MSKSKLAKLPKSPAKSFASPLFLQQTADLKKCCLSGKFVSYRRALRKIYPKDHLIKLSACTSRESAMNLIGNAVEFRNEISGRSLNGVIRRVHGNSGVVMARFKEGGLSPKDIGSEVLVKLYKVPIEEYFE
ncbi:60S ribosomal protein L33-A [Cucumispora dikerogammari]|nr:60S ribosomal protein L33-A [Cucumispora dikerogammari]